MGNPQITDASYQDGAVHVTFTETVSFKPADFKDLARLDEAQLGALKILSFGEGISWPEGNAEMSSLNIWRRYVGERRGPLPQELYESPVSRKAKDLVAAIDKLRALAQSQTPMANHEAADDVVRTALAVLARYTEYEQMTPLVLEEWELFRAGH